MSAALCYFCGNFIDCDDGEHLLTPDELNFVCQDCGVERCCDECEEYPCRCDALLEAQAERNMEDYIDIGQQMAANQRRDKMTNADHYFKGDACKFTGETTELYGGLFYVYEIIEGHRKGEIIVSQSKPKSLGA